MKSRNFHHRQVSLLCLESRGYAVCAAQPISLYGNEDIECFGAALNAEEDRKHGLRMPPNVIFVEGLYRETVKYTEQVRRYLHIFGRENVCIVIYDDFKNEPAKVYGETLRFLGVRRFLSRVLKLSIQTNSNT